MRSLEHVAERFAGRHSLCQYWTATSSRKLRLQIHRNSHSSPSLPLSSVFSSLRLRRVLDIVLQFCSTDAPTSSAGPLLLHTAHTSLHCFILIHLPFLHPPSRPSPTMSYSYATAKAVLSDVDKDRILAMHLSQSDISNVSRQ